MYQTIGDIEYNFLLLIKQNKHSACHGRVSKDTCANIIRNGKYATLSCHRYNNDKSALAPHIQARRNRGRRNKFSGGGNMFGNRGQTIINNGVDGEVSSLISPFMDF